MKNAAKHKLNLQLLSVNRGFHKAKQSAGFKEYKCKQDLVLYLKTEYLSNKNVYFLCHFLRNKTVFQTSLELC